MTDNQSRTLKEHLVAVTKFFTKDGVDIKPYPKVILKRDNSSEDITAPTGNYQPETNTIVLYCNGRHIKDVLNTYTHELWHRHQDVQGKLDPEKIGESASYSDGNEYLKEIERDAYVNGNIMRRKYTESLQKQS